MKTTTIEINIENKSDSDGNPAGGSVRGLGISIDWQDGPLGNGPSRKLPNGAFVEDVLWAVLQRLKFFQESKFKCRENSLAITKIEEALHWLDHRTQDRIARGVEGGHSV